MKPKELYKDLLQVFKKHFRPENPEPDGPADHRPLRARRQRKGLLNMELELCSSSPASARRR